jgi:predicted GIY-YIG superfamily endonuclease
MTLTKELFIESLNHQLDGKGRVYVLRLEQDYYYIGWTEQLGHRLFKHFNNDGCAMTKAFKPIEVVDIYVGNKLKESEIVLKYRDLYGKDKVKGAGDTRVPKR